MKNIFNKMINSSRCYKYTAAEDKILQWVNSKAFIRSSNQFHPFLSFQINRWYLVHGWDLKGPVDESTLLWNSSFLLIIKGRPLVNYLKVPHPWMLNWLEDHILCRSQNENLFREYLGHPLPLPRTLYSFLQKSSASCHQLMSNALHSLALILL